MRRSLRPKRRTQSEVEVEYRDFNGPHYYVVRDLNGQPDLDEIPDVVQRESRDWKANAVLFGEQDLYHVSDGEGDRNEDGVVVHSWVPDEDESHD